MQECKKRKAEEEQNDQLKKKPKPSRQTIESCLAKTQPFDSKHHRVSDITNIVGLMLALDLQLYSIAENIGFRRLIKVLEQRYTLPSRKTISENVIPKLYADVQQRMVAMIQDCVNISCTTDAWITECDPTSYLGVTGHWVDDQFVRKSALLGLQHLPSSNWCQLSNRVP